MEKKEILKINYWKLDNICEYFNVSKQKAHEIRMLSISKYDGYSPLMPKLTKKESIFKALSIDINKEFELYNKEEKDND